VTAARDKLDRLKRIAHEMERENPEMPMTELLDLQRALKRTLPKMRALRAAGLEFDSPAMAARIGGMCSEMEELSQQGDSRVTNVTSLDDRRKPAPGPAIADWVERADAEVSRTSSSPNEILNHLLAAGCKVSFEQDGPEIAAEVTMPDGSTVSHSGPNPVGTLILAYAAGAWLADLPAALAATAEPSKGAS
jgi:hypothetical protein